MTKTQNPTPETTKNLDTTCRKCHRPIIEYPRLGWVHVATGKKRCR